MLFELPRGSYARIAPLFAELDYHLSIPAVVAGSMPGRAFADDADRPAVAVISSPEGTYLAGTAPPAEAAPAVARLIAGELRVYGEIALFAAERWLEQSATLFAGFAHVVVPRRHYALRRPAGARHEQAPEGFTLARLDGSAFARPALREHHIERWARGNWGSVEAFLERGFGFALFDGDLPVSWSLADSAVGARCEIGIHTHEAYRRRGMATTVVAANVEHALAHGYAEVGWHCGEENLGSQGVAEKVGFALTHRFAMIWSAFTPA